MLRRVLFLTACLLGATSCVGTEPPAAPAAPVVAPPSRPAPVQIAVRYEPRTALRLTRGAVPVRGAVQLTVEKRVRGVVYVAPATVGPERPPRDALLLTPDDDGLAVLGEGALGILVDALGPDSTIKLFQRGVRVELSADPAALGGRLSCGARLERLRSTGACTEPRPAIDAASCPEDGRRAVEEAERTRAAKEGECWTVVDDSSAKQLATVRDAALKKAACAKLVPLLASEAVAATEAAERVTRECGSGVPEEVQRFVRRARLLATIDDAYERAKTGASPDMRAFYERYYETGDARVEEIRKVALQRFGPPNPTRFRAAQKTLSAMRSPNFTASICDLRRDGTAIATVNSTTRTAVHVIGGLLLGTQDPLQRSIRAAEISQQRVTSAVKATTGAKHVLFPLMGTCEYPHWYLNDRPWPPKQETRKLPGGAPGASR